jgi:hypothetical protein
MNKKVIIYGMLIILLVFAAYWLFTFYNFANGVKNDSKNKKAFPDTVKVNDSSTFILKKINSDTEKINK